MVFEFRLVHVLGSRRRIRNVLLGLVERYSFEHSDVFFILCAGVLYVFRGIENALDQSLLHSEKHEIDDR